MRGVATAILDELDRVGPLSAEDLAGRLGQPVGAVEQALVDNDFVFEPVDGSQTWRVLSPQAFGSALSLSRLLRQWQVDALQKWFLGGRSGVVEAVTGAGKTDVALAAIVEARRRGLATLIVVPDRQTADAWSRALSVAIPSSIVGRVETGTGALDAFPILIVDSSMLGDRRLRFGLRPRLLVADEVHRLTVADYANLSTIGAVRDKLALTATYEWPDLRAERVLKPYFGEVIDGCDYQRAVNDGLMEPPTVMTVGVHFSTTETGDYRAASDKVTAAAKVLQDAGDGAPEGAFVLARRLDADAAPGPLTATARALLRADRDRRLILSRCAAKVSIVAAVRQAVRRTGSVGIYFSYDGTNVTDRVEVPAFGTEPDQHRVGVITAAPRTRAAMTGQMSRVLDLGSKAPAAFVVVYVNGTIEDPHVDSDAVDFAALRKVARDFSDVSTGDAVSFLTNRLGESHSRVDAPTKREVIPDGPLEAPDTWSVTDAIYDIFDEHQGFPLWNEIKELLPDIEADQALRDGVDGISWMPIGSGVVGAGGNVRSDRVERVSALAILSEVFEELGAEPQKLSDLAEAFSRSSLLSENLRTGRIRELWEGLGGSFATSSGGAGQARMPSGVGVQSAVEGPPVDMDPALRRILMAFRAAVGQRGGSLRGPLGSRKDEYEVTDSRGVRRPVRLAADHGGVWSLPKSELNQASSAVRVFMNPLDYRHFYVFTASEFRQVMQDVNKRSAIELRGKSKRKSITFQMNAIATGLDRWDKLGALTSVIPKVSRPVGFKESRKAPAVDRLMSTPSSNTTPPVEEARVSPDSKPTGSAAAADTNPLQVRPKFDGTGRVRVSLVAEAGTVPGIFVCATGEMEIQSVSAAGKHAGKKFRNAAMASAAVRSLNTQATVFTDGISDWIVDGTHGKRLADYLSTETWLIDVPVTEAAS